MQRIGRIGLVVVWPLDLDLTDMIVICKRELLDKLTLDVEKHSGGDSNVVGCNLCRVEKY